MNEIVLDDEDDNDDIDNVDVVYLQREHHLGVSRAFVAAVRRQLQRDFSRQRLLTIALNSDFAVCGRGIALGDDALRNDVLRGSTVLQIDEVSDIATQYEERIKFADNARRCLRFRLTDGVNSVAAIECVRVPQLSIATAPGSKLLLTDVPISRRILLLSPGNCRLLGGAVRALYDAQAAVRLAEASRVTVLPQPLAARPVPQLAAAPPPPPPPRQMQMNDDASVHGTPEQFLVPARQYDDDEFDLNAFLAAENEALHVQKRLRSANDEARSNTTIDLNEEDVDDLVRVVTQVPDSSSDSEDFEKPTTKAKATTMTTTTTTITTASTKMIDLDLCDDDDDCDVTTFGLFG